jgi:hypothetical protein
VNHEDVAIELARIVRECEAAVIARIASRQLGEAFQDFPRESLSRANEENEECTI